MGHYDYDLALKKMSGLIHDAELERAAAEGRSARLSRPGPRARVRAAFTALRGGDGTLATSRDCLEAVIVAHGRPA
jgi:hypothetical protein